MSIETGPGTDSRIRVLLLTDRVILKNQILRKEKSSWYMTPSLPFHKHVAIGRVIVLETENHERGRKRFGSRFEHDCLFTFIAKSLTVSSPERSSSIPK